MTLGKLRLQPPLDPRSYLFDRLFPSVDERLQARVDQHRHWQDFHKNRAFWAGFHAADGSSYVTRKSGTAGHQYTVDHRDRRLLEYFMLQLGSLGKIISSDPRKEGYLGYNDYVPPRTRACAGALVFLFGDFIHVDSKRAGAKAVARRVLNRPLPDNPLESYHPTELELAYSFGFWLGDGSAVLTLRENGQMAKAQVSIANALRTDMLLHQLHLGGHLVIKKSYNGGEASSEWRFAAGEEVRFFARYARGFEAFGQSAKSLARVFNLEKLY
jgi:hypothetical protein